MKSKLMTALMCGAAGVGAYAAPAPTVASAVEAKDDCHDPQRFMEAQGRMRTEMQAAYEAAGRDAARAGPALDALVARYQPCWDGFAADQRRQFEVRVENAPRAERAAMRERAAPWLRDLGRGAVNARGDLQRNGTLVPPPPPPPPSPSPAKLKR